MLGILKLGTRFCYVRFGDLRVLVQNERLLVFGLLQHGLEAERSEDIAETGVELAHELDPEGESHLLANMLVNHTLRRTYQ